MALRARETPADEEAFAVMPENQAAVRLFMAAASQWRTAPLGLAGFAFTGIDYGAARVAWEAHGLDPTPDDFGGFQVMEAAAAQALNAQREQEREREE